MVKLIVCKAAPPVLLAQIVYIVCVMFTVGVPEITPSTNDKPDGKDGSIAQSSTIPERIGAISVIACPRVKV